MAIHAGLGRGNASEAGNLHRSMAIAAVNAQPCHMVLMAEGDGLRLAHAGIGNVRGALHLHGNPQQGSNHKYRAKNCGPGQGIGAAMKNLRHAYEVSDEPASQCYSPSSVKRKPRDHHQVSTNANIKTGDYKYSLK